MDEQKLWAKQRLLALAHLNDIEVGGIKTNQLLAAILSELQALRAEIGKASAETK